MIDLWTVLVFMIGMFIGPVLLILLVIAGDSIGGWKNKQATLRAQAEAELRAKNHVESGTPFDQSRETDVFGG